MSYSNDELLNKMAGCPYASLQTYYKLPPAPKKQGQGKKAMGVFAIPEFGSVGYNHVPKPKTSTGNQCHVWRNGDYDGRVLSKNAYPQCGPGSSCDQYTSRY